MPAPAATSATDGISASTSTSPSTPRVMSPLRWAVSARPSISRRSRGLLLHVVGCLFPWYFRRLYSRARACTERSPIPVPGCPLDIVIPYGSHWDCCRTAAVSTTRPATSTPIPTAPPTPSAPAAALQSIADRSGNGLTITRQRHHQHHRPQCALRARRQNRITQITDPQGNVYSYGYDANGNLASVTYPATAAASTCPGATLQHQPIQLLHRVAIPTTDHYYAGGTDGRCNPLPVTTYYDSTTDGGNSALDGRLASVTDAFGNTTSYAYNLRPPAPLMVSGSQHRRDHHHLSADANGNVGTATMVYDSLRRSAQLHRPARQHHHQHLRREPQPALDHRPARPHHQLHLRRQRQQDLVDLSGHGHQH